MGKLSRLMRVSCGLESTVWLLALTIAFLAASPAAGQGAKVAAQRSFPSLVLLMMEDGQGQPLSLGSGFIVRPGVIATNVHVVSGASRGWARLIGQKQRHPVEGAVAIDEGNDLALLSIPGAAGAPSLRLADSTKVAVGDEVFALGNPLGLEGTVSSGIVSGIRTAGNTSFIQITAPISPGRSGGPIVDTRGDVIGVAVATFRGGQNLNFAIPAQQVASLLQRGLSAPEALHNLTGKRRGSSQSKFAGEKGISGVVAAHVDCFKPDPSNPFMSWDCSFSVQNKLQSSVGSVRAIFIL